MPYLNWKITPVPPVVAVEEHPRYERQLRLTLARPALEELVSGLEEVFQAAGPELRLDLPEEWTLFWKARESESRLLLAHPQPTQWVATLALDPDHGRQLLAALRALASGESCPVSRGGTPGRVSNVEIVIGLQ